MTDPKTVAVRELGRKDVALALDAAREAGLELTVAPAVIAAMDRAIASGHGDDDIAAVLEPTRAS